MIEKNVKLWIGDGPLVSVRVSQFDTIWRFVFSIIHNSQPWQIPTGATAVLNGRKPDSNVFAFSGTISDNTVTVDCDVQMTAVAGQTVCELSILKVRYPDVDGAIYESIIDNNVWGPADYPAGWKIVE